MHPAERRPDPDDGWVVRVHVLLNATDHGAVGRMVSAHADELNARAVVIGARPTAACRR